MQTKYIIVKRIQFIDYYDSGLFIFLLTILCIIVITGCNSVSPKDSQVPEELLEKVIIARETGQNGWIYENAYWPNGSPTPRDDWIDRTSYSDSEREILLGLLRGNYSYRSNYDGLKATIVVDISETGIPEWKNVNKFRRQADISSSSQKYYRNRVFYFIYKNRKWRYVFIAGGPDWPEPEFIE